MVRPGTITLPRLQNGDRLTGDEFERRAAAMPDDGTRWELIEGVVYMVPPVTEEHATPHFLLTTCLGHYVAKTPGTMGGSDATLRLGEKNRPQPDISLYVTPEAGGRIHRDPDHYLRGAVELVCEVAYTSASIDLHDKKKAYRKAGCLEYLVLDVEKQEVSWFELGEGEYRALEPERGILKSRVFPGLWLDVAALLARDLPKVLATLDRGLASKEHGELVKKLARARKS
jgi:Uma2 family endonuclease